jgi:hypothetical protein
MILTSEEEEDMGGRIASELEGIEFGSRSM